MQNKNGCNYWVLNHLIFFHSLYFHPALWTTLPHQVSLTYPHIYTLNHELFYSTRRLSLFVVFYFLLCIYCCSMWLIFERKTYGEKEANAKAKWSGMERILTHFHQDSVGFGNTFWHAVRANGCKDNFSSWWFGGVGLYGKTRKVYSTWTRTLGL